MNIIRIEDLSLPELAIFNERAETQLYHMYEPEPGIFIAETARVIKRALDAGYEPLCMLAEEHVFETEMSHEEDRIDPERLGNIPVYIGSDDVLCKLTGYHLTRGLICAMRRTKVRSLEEVLAGAGRVAVLEDVMNPINVGAIFRSAAALGTDAVILTGGSSDPLYRRAIRVSMGTVFVLPWTVYEGGTAGLIEELRKQGFITAAMALRHDTVQLGEHDFGNAKKLAIVLGTEGEGLKEDTIKACDLTVKIPMERGVDSLNVAAASAVAFWEIRKKC